MLRRFQLSRLQLASQFTLLLSIIFIAGIVMGSWAISKALEQKAIGEMTYRGQMAMEMINAVQNYTSSDIAPLLAEIGNPETKFIPETIPNLGVKRVLNHLKENWKYKDFVYKDATLNPTNLDDKADLFESQLTQKFERERFTSRKLRTLKTLSGFRSQSGNQLFYSAQPLVVTDSSCLKCHTSPSIAPKSHVEKYGTQNGYGWKLNQVVGSQIIYIPASEVFKSSRKALFLFINIFIIVFALVLFAINYLLRWRVILPLKPIAQIAEFISQDAATSNKVNFAESQDLKKISQRQDEFGKLGRVFTKMISDIHLREQHLSAQIKKLQVEIDVKRVEEEVAEIADSDYFQNLKNTAQDMRKQWKD
jgi:methyl-accepting chemotaxis protein